MTIKISYSQTLSITYLERDSIFSKITRGNEAIENNKILKARIVVKDSVIGVQTEIMGIQKTDLGLKDEQISLLDKVIDNLKVIAENEKKRGRRKGFYGFIKGAGAGFLLALLLLF